MNRLVIPKKPGIRSMSEGEPNSDNAVGRLVKYIPGEIISGYMLLSGIVDGGAQSSPLRIPATWALFCVGTLLTPLYLWRMGRPSGARWWQLPISTVSFVLWAYALGGPFIETRLFGYTYESWFGALLAGAFSWGIALVWQPNEA